MLNVFLRCFTCLPILVFVLNSMINCGHFVAEFKTGIYTNMKLTDKYIMSTAIGVSFNQCLQDCRDRRACLSVSYQIRTHYCMLGITETSRKSYSLETAPGYLYGDKYMWNKVHDTVCNNCSRGEVCVRTTNKTRCEIQECAPPTIDLGVQKLGNIWLVGSRVKFWCRLDPCSKLSTQCLSNGSWSDANRSVCHTVLPDLERKKYHITSNLSGRWWHDDASKQDVITTMYGQGPYADGFTLFSFVKVRQLPGNKYLIMCMETGMYITDGGYAGLVCRQLKSMANFIFDISKTCDGYRLYSEKVGRFVYYDRDRILTTLDRTDASSVFRFVEVLP